MTTTKKHTAFAGTILVFCLAATEASAKTIHVSGSGSDGNDGLTAGTALRTLQKAADKTSAGDLVSVGAGTYDAFTIQTSGADGGWIRYVVTSRLTPS